jgi:hypothetical protein
VIATGEILGTWDFTVEAGKVRAFARAVGQEDWREEMTVPLTFTVVCAADFVERLVTEILPVDRSRTVHGGQSYEYFTPIRVGDLLRCRARLVSDETKRGRRGGMMRVIQTEIEYRSASTNELLCRETMTSIETGADEKDAGRS